MSQALDIETEVALRIRRAVRSGRLLGAIWSELYRLDRDQVIKLRVATVDEITPPPRANSDRRAFWRKISASAQRFHAATARLAAHLRAVFRTWAKRRRARLELLDYLAQDHRAAADMGTTRAAADNWAQQPFWRP